MAVKEKQYKTDGIVYLSVLDFFRPLFLLKTIFYSEMVLPYVFGLKPVYDHFKSNAEAKKALQGIEVYFLPALLFCNS